MHPRAFTLIELLIVVAIIAILAAIAVPNFLEAQTRAKVSRTRADQRTLALAIECYRVDANAYPPCIDINTFITTNLTPGYAATPRINRLVILSTPVAYLSSIPLDPFGAQEAPDAVISDPRRDRVYDHWGPDALISWHNVDRRPDTRLAFCEFPQAVSADGTVREPLWALFGHGPDTDYDVYDPAGQTTQVLAPNLSVVQPYDPTNGAASDGDLVRWRE